LKLVPAERLGDLVLVHPTDPRGAFTMNILERLGDDVEGEHGRIIGELLDFLKRSQWREVPEAFGPMFENYFRNGLQLLLNAVGDNASILDFPRIFSDEAYRHELLCKCTNPDVSLFWTGIVEEAQYEAKLSNHAPYIVCKMSPITGNTHLKRILGANRSSLDFGRVIDAQQICLINLAQPYLAKDASRFLGGMITARLVASAKVMQASIPDEQRKRVNVYMDEFQTYISAGLAEGLAEVRKYGLNMVLANQSLSQLQGDRYQTEVAEAVLSNAANVIAFRVGIHDAARLGRRFEPELPAQCLAKLPNYHAAGIVVRGSDVSTPEIFSTLPEPQPQRGEMPTQGGVHGEPLAGARERIVRLIGERGAAMRRAS
jgi:TraM recognition site of TraD and TraG